MAKLKDYSQADAAAKVSDRLSAGYRSELLLVEVKSSNTKKAPLLRGLLINRLSAESYQTQTNR